MVQPRAGRWHRLWWGNYLAPPPASMSKGNKAAYYVGEVAAELVRARMGLKLRWAFVLILPLIVIAIAAGLIEFAVSGLESLFGEGAAASGGGRG